MVRSRSNKRKSSRPSPRSGAGNQVRHLPSPKRRLRDSLAVLTEVTEAATKAALSIRFSREQAPVVRFELSVLERGVNALKAVRVLCENGHWEFAVPAVRQLFELVLNLEQIDAATERREAAARYERFAMLQMLRLEVASLEYDQKKDRPIDEERLATGRALLDAPLFEEFRETGKKGQTLWADSWSGMNVWEMAKASPLPLRPDQYRLLFSPWSEQTHASPSAVLAGLFRSSDSAEDIVAKDEVRIAETIASAVTHFLELWSLLPAIPGPDPAQMNGWFERMLEVARRYGSGASGPS